MQTVVKKTNDTGTGVAKYAEAKHRLVISLKPNQLDDLIVQSCEVTGPQSTNRTTFRGTPLFIEVFSADIADQLVRELDRLPKLTEDASHDVASYPDWSITCAGCVLSGLRIIRSYSEENGLRIVLRFRVFVGNLSQITTIDTAPEQDIGRITDTIAFDVFCDVALPILDLVRLGQPAANFLTEEIAQKLKHIFERSDELRFRTELLQRLAQQGSRLGGAADRGPLEPFRQAIEAVDTCQSEPKGSRLVCELGNVDGPFIL